MTARRTRRQSLSERLPYWGIRDGVVFTRTRGAEIAVEFTLPSATELTPAARERLAEALRLILVQAVPEGTRGRILVEAAPMSEADLPAALMADTDNDLLRFLVREDARVQDLRRLQGQLTQWRTYFTLRLDGKPRGGVPVPYLERELQALVHKGVALRTQLVNMLRAAGFGARPLSSQEAYEVIWRYFNPGFASARPPLLKSVFTPPNVPVAELKKDFTRHSDTLRAQIAHSEIDTSRFDALVVGDRLVQTVNLLGPGDSTYPGMTERLLRRLAGHHAYLVLDFEHLKQHDERKKLNNAARGAAVAVQDVSLGTPDVANSAVLDNLGGILYKLTAAEEHVFTFGVSVILVARTKEELEAMKEVTRTELSLLGGARAAAGDVQNIPQYLDALPPLNARVNEFMFRAFSANVAHLVPQVGPWKGSDKPIALYRNRFGGLTGLNPADGMNYGTLIVGSSGSGKTFFTQSWLARTAALGADLIIVDQKRDYASFIGALGGQFVPFAPGEKVGEDVVRFNAFALPPGEHEPDENHKLFLLAYVNALLGGHELGATERALITAAIEQVYQAATTRDSAGNVRFTEVTLSRFVATLKNLAAVGNESLRDNTAAHAALKHLTLSLQTFLGDTPLGSFLDGESTISLQSPYLYFDISRIREQPELTRLALLLIVKLVWERAKANPERTKVAVIEEIGVLFDLPEALEFVAGLYRLGRAYNLWPVGVTQQIADFQKGRALIENSSLYVIGRVGAEEAGMVASVLGLNDAAHGLLLSLSGERGVYAEYLALSRIGDGLAGDVIQLFPNAIEYWMFTSHPVERARRDETIARFGGDALAAIRSLAGAAT